MATLDRGIILIDSTVIIHHLRQKHQKKRTLFELTLSQCSLVCISVVSIFEIEVGALSAGRSSDIEQFLTYMRVIDMNLKVANAAAKLVAQLKQKKKVRDIRDIFIAASALAHGLPLLTNNVSHFHDMDGLQVSNRLN